MLTDGFLRRVAKESLRTCVPARDDTIQTFADDGIIGGIYNRSKQPDRLVGFETQRGQLVQKRLAHAIRRRFRIVKDTVRQCFMGRKKLFNVILKLDFRMNLGPIVRCPNECQQQQQLLKSDCT